MRRLFLFASAVLVASSFSAHAQKQWTVADIYGKGISTGHEPGEMTWAPDGSRAVYIDEHGDLIRREGWSAFSAALSVGDSSSQI